MAVGIMEVDEITKFQEIIVLKQLVQMFWLFQISVTTKNSLG